jgi:hypothetical protein
MWTRLKSWLGAVRHRARMETEMDTELRFHVDAYAQDLMRRGMPERSPAAGAVGVLRNGPNERTVSRGALSRVR